MNQPECLEVATFQKELNGKILHCQVQIFSDGSAYVDGDDLEVIFEESPDAFLDALAFVEQQGYTRITAEENAGFKVHRG